MQSKLKMNLLEIITLRTLVFFSVLFLSVKTENEAERYYNE